jgi:transposase
MDADLAALPDDIDALKAALVIERARMRDVIAERDAGAAELAVARAKASEDLALIAHQKLRIAQLERQVYGPRSERSQRLIDQLALQFEELAAGATELSLPRKSPWRRPRWWRASRASASNGTPSPTTCRASVW